MMRLHLLQRLDQDNMDGLDGAKCEVVMQLCAWQFCHNYTNWRTTGSAMTTCVWRLYRFRSLRRPDPGLDNGTVEVQESGMACIPQCV